MQAALTKMVRMFERVVFQTNLNYTMAVICMLGLIWGQHGAEAYKRRATGEGPTFRESKRTRILCEECGETMSAYFMRHHMERENGIVLSQVRVLEFRLGGM